MPSEDAGCTALAALVLPDTTLIANAGDCVAHLWRGGAAGAADSLERVSRDHNAAVPEEAARVAAAGGIVQTTADGKARVGGVIQVAAGLISANLTPLFGSSATLVIQVTRCIGDRRLRHLGLSSEPELRCCARAPTDVGIVLASDGLWDVMDEARVLHCLTHTARSADMLAKRLVLEAMDRGTTDNVTCAVVLF